MKSKNNIPHGTQLGMEIKEGLKGLNTCASSRSKKKCEKFIIIPLITFYASFLLIGISNENSILGTLAVIPYLISCLSMGIYQFYLGKFKRGIVYTLTAGWFTIGVLVDLFKLKVTHNLCDSNNFPLIY